MKTRETIIDQIKALLSKTIENGATEAEMLSALDKASAMRDAHVITDAELALSKEEAAMLHADPPDLADPHSIKWRLTHAVGQFCGVQIYRHGGETGLKAVGMPSDVEQAMWLLDMLADFTFDQLYAHLIGCCAPKGERRTIMRSFVEGCCHRINDRLRELAERSKASRTSANGRELVIVKAAAVKAFLKDHNIRLRCSGGSQSSNVNEAARAAGAAAGGRASFGRPVSGSAGVLRLVGPSRGSS